MEMKVVFLVVKLCIIIIVSLVHESAGYTISPSPTIFSILSPIKARTPSPVYDEKSPRTSSPSLSPLPTVIHAPEVSQPGNTAPVPKYIAPSVPPSPPKVVPSLKPAPLPQVIQDPSMPPSPPKVVPSQKPAPLPHVVQGLVPSLPPSLSEVVPSQKPAPLPQVIQGFVPSMPPSPPKVVPSQKPAPLPQVIQGFVPSIPPSPPKVVPSNKPAPLPQVIQGFVPSMPPNPPLVIPSHKPAPPPQVIQGFVPSTLPNPPLDIPSHKPAPPPQVIQGLIPSMSPIDTSHRRKPKSKLPVKMPLSPAPTASPPRKFPQTPPAVHPATPGIAPSMLSDPAISPISVPPPSSNRKTYRGPLAAPPLFNHFPRAAHPPTKGSFPVVAPPPHKATGLSNAPAPSKLSPKPAEKKWFHSPAPSPLNSFYRYHHARKNASHPALAPSFLFPPPSSYHQGPIIPPANSHSPEVLPKKHRRRQRHPPAMNNAPSVSPVKPPFPPTVRQGSLVPSPASAASSGQTKRTFVPPTSSPTGSFPRKPKTPLPSPVESLPPPPPNQDCTSLVCTEPLTNSPPGSPCGCVAPMQVGLRLSVALYTFFPLVSELAVEIATGVFMKLSQVRIMGANAAGQQLDKTTVLIDLVPLGEKFDNTTALLAYEKFWHKQVDLKPSFFGDYEVLYVRYPGLPPSPPFASSSITTIDGQYPGHRNNARTIKPLGVDVKRKRNGGLGGSMIAIIILSSSIALALFIGAAWLLLLKCRNHNCQLLAPTRQLIVPSLSKPPGTAGSMMFGSGPSSASMSFGSSLTTHPGTAKTFSAGEMEKATDNFAASRILGEGGFGLVYRGILDDGTEVAVKVLKRDDQQGGREFLAEVEMLSRLHHRNLVKLIGICIEDHARSLVYELIPNGSVESHLHGLDKESAPLDWGARMKIALGAARGLAYLHEDSSPHVIHRDFKCSNILLEHDFTPKVADFGLARTALDEGNQHITTRVMGTFGYVAPEYAMTGHLLVKSDVYSYGVVLLELLTGRKPVDMSQPQGQENLVSWARPFLTSKEGLEILIDPALGSNVLFDHVAKVSAIASMCVQPEVSHRPFMGEVVQALKLVCNECDETKAGGSESGDQEDFSVVDVDTRTSTDSGQLPESSCAHYTIPDSNSSFDVDRDLSASDVFNTSETFGRQASGSFRRHSSSGPLTTGRSRQFWQRIRSMSGGSINEHGAAFRL